MLCTGLIRTGWSEARDAGQAVRELHAQIGSDEVGSGFFFCSSRHDLEAVGAAMTEAFGDSMVGCTTAGEITPGGYSERGLTGFFVPESCGRINHYLLEDITSLDLERIGDIGDRVTRARNEDVELDQAQNEFGLLLIDGMSVMEEQVVGALKAAVGGLPLVGGSAGDDTRFRETWVFHGGRFHSNAAIFSHVRTSRAVHVFKTQHFEPTETKLVITKAIPEKRLVTEINGRSAAGEFARLVGHEVHELNAAVFSRYPVMLKVGGEYYVRSIQQAGPDGSLTFYCAIDEGLVLTMARSLDFVEQLSGALAEVQEIIPDPELLIGFECILRRLEVLDKKISREVGAIMAESNVVGFHTYGEQFGALHVNQTFTGVAIGR